MVNSIFKTYEVTVDTMRDSIVSQAMRYSQNDLKSAKILITVNHNGKEEDFSEATAVRVSFEKGDKKIVYQDCQPINVLKGKYQVLLTTQTLTSVGIVTANVHIYFPNDKKIETGSFTFEVVESKMSDEVIKSTDAFPAIHKAIETGEQLKGIDIQALIASKNTAEAVNKKADRNAVQIGDLQKIFSKQDVKTQTLQHGPNIVNATVASPLNVEVQGRTLVNLLGQTTLDPTKYYLFMPNKGTTKITAGGSSYDGVAKFTGQSAISYTIKQDYRGKVAGSTVENGHIARRTWSHSTLNTLAKPTETSSSIGEVEQQRYADYIFLDGKYSPTSVNFDGGIAQEMHSFDVIRALQDKFGIQIWQGKTALADKITIAKQLVVDYAAVLYANGFSPQGNKLYVKRWIPSTSTWFGSTSTTESNLTKVQTGSTNVQEIDNNGFIHVIAYADASDGTRPSVVNVDYAMLELKTNMDTPLLEDALYEVDQATYNKINVHPDFTGQKLIDKYPYVEGVQHLNPILIAEGVNLVPNLTEWTHPANSKLIETDTIEIYSTGLYQQSTINIPALPNMEYVYTVEEVSGNGAFVGVNFKDDKGTFISQISANNNAKELKFTTPSTCNVIQMKCSGRLAGENILRFRKPMLNIGSTPKLFVPRNLSYLYANTFLSGCNGINDVLYKEDGQWKVLRKWERDLNLYGDILDWKPNGNRTGGKEFVITFSSKEGVGILSRYDGISVSYSILPVNNGDGFNNSGGASLRITVPNKDTGFSESYTPIGDEIKAYFNGWKVKNADGTGKPTAWVSLVDGQDVPTQTLAFVKVNRAPNYTPYKLTYQLVTPKIEIVQVEGDLVFDGLTQVTVDSGVVVREKANPKQFNKEYYINRGDNNAMFLPTRLKNRVLRVLKVFKNGVEETRVNRYADKTSPSYGEECISIPEAIYDPSAEYTVTYLTLDKHLFTTNATDVKTSYNQSIRSTVDELTVRQSDTITGLSSLQNLMTDVLARLKANSL
ncbi:BppU family phage baseplate upper protein [Bacillus sp. FDAARGOS_235]|uniref:BppU family phage baseplate upper protein n=1 Tax=Bacillus sp. FDAARGOS_235 TaxID=1839798 RepID=UPI0011AA5D2F|nr:BppU family phage baseplate upper protein [Bacillus sp. FDAARGOS_235]